MKPRIIIHRLWLRGFLPAIILLVPGLIASGAWMVWQGPGSVPVRAVIGKGVIMVAWFDPKNPAIRRWIGPRNWYLSVGYTDAAMTKPFRGWYVTRPFWSPNRLNIDPFPRVHDGELQLPLLAAAAALALPPAALLLWRRFHPLRNTWQCPGCGYSLAGLAEGGACPECGVSKEPR